MHLTVLIPAFNESKRITATLKKVEAYLSKKPWQWEILVVDDGSTDNTEATVRSALAGSGKLRIIRHDSNRGKGAAVKTGILSSNGDYTLFMDADSSTDIEEFEKFLPFVDSNTPVIIGSRKVAGSNVEKHQPFMRELLGKGFTLMSNVVLGTRISDFTCGFKCFRKDACRKIGALQSINNWSYDTEILYIAEASGYGIREVPIRWLNDPNSKVRLLRDITTSFYGLVKIMCNRVMGRYDG